MMLNSIAFEDGHATVIAMDRARHGHRSLRVKQTVSFVVTEFEKVRDTVELATRHVEDGTAVYRLMTHRRPPSEPTRCSSRPISTKLGPRELPNFTEIPHRSPLKGAETAGDAARI
jgi:hypothetical protein